MYEIELYPNFDKLKEFEGLNSLHRLKNQNGVTLTLEYWTEQIYLEYSGRLKELIQRSGNGLSEHYEELLYLSLVVYNLIFESHYYNQDEYLDQQEKSEVAKLLLALMEFKLYKEERHLKDLRINRKLSLLVKYQGFDVETTNVYFAEWILDQMFNSIKMGDSPYYHINDTTFSEMKDGELVLSYEKVKSIANLNVRRPN